jgi:hypothetical protein
VQREWRRVSRGGSITGGGTCGGVSPWDDHSIACVFACSVLFVCGLLHSVASKTRSVLFWDVTQPTLIVTDVSGPVSYFVPKRR